MQRILLFGLFLINLLTDTSNAWECLCSAEVERLREYITINTSNGEGLRQAVGFWRKLAAQQDIETHVFECEPNYPLILLRWPGSNSSLTSILLISHIDVVPAYYEDGWTYAPFSAHVNEDCEIFGRGAQNMKSVAIQHYEALSSLNENDETLLRDVYMIITPDGTSGSLKGLARFVKTEDFQNLNVGLTLGVGQPSADSEMFIYYQDKTQYLIQLDCYGQTLHSAAMSDVNTLAIGPCGRFFAAYSTYREEQYTLSLTSTDYSDYTAINLIGVDRIAPYRVIPAHIRMYYVVYLAHNTSLEEFNNTIRGWAAGPGDFKLSLYYEAPRSLITKTDDSNPYWVTIQEVFDELNITLKAHTSPTTTDVKFVVDTGVPGFGLSPLRNTPITVNGIDESISISVYSEGITVFKEVIRRLANLPNELIPDDTSTYLIKPTIV